MRMAAWLFIAIAMALTAVTQAQLPPGSNSACGKERVRKSWDGMTDDEKTLFKRAFSSAMGSGEVMRFVQTHMEIQSNQQAHKTCAFIPWHRRYVLAFENMLRSQGDEFTCVTIPYWNVLADYKRQVSGECKNVWECSSVVRETCDDIATTKPKPRSMTINGRTRKNFPCYGNSEFTSNLKNYTDDNGEEINCWIRGDHIKTLIQAGSSISAVGKLMQVNNHVDFSSRMEGAIHAEVHNAAGGLVSTFAAPHEPLFWFWHSSIDLIGYTYQRCHLKQTDDPLASIYGFSQQDNCNFRDDLVIPPTNLESQIIQNTGKDDAPVQCEDDDLIGKYYQPLSKDLKDFVDYNNGNFFEQEYVYSYEMTSDFAQDLLENDDYCQYVPPEELAKSSGDDSSVSEDSSNDSATASSSASASSFTSGSTSSSAAVETPDEMSTDDDSGPFGGDIVAPSFADDIDFSTSDSASNGADSRSMSSASASLSADVEIPDSGSDSAPSLETGREEDAPSPRVLETGEEETPAPEGDATWGSFGLSSAFDDLFDGDATVQSGFGDGSTDRSMGSSSHAVGDESVPDNGDGSSSTISMPPALDASVGDDDGAPVEPTHRIDTSPSDGFEALGAKSLASENPETDETEDAPAPEESETNGEEAQAAEGDSAWSSFRMSSFGSWFGSEEAAASSSGDESMDSSSSLDSLDKSMSGSLGSGRSDDEVTIPEDESASSSASMSTSLEVDTHKADQEPSKCASKTKRPSADTTPTEDVTSPPRENDPEAGTESHSNDEDTAYHVHTTTPPTPPAQSSEDEDTAYPVHTTTPPTPPVQSSEDEDMAYPVHTEAPSTYKEPEVGNEASISSMDGPTEGATSTSEASTTSTEAPADDKPKFITATWDGANLSDNAETASWQQTPDQQDTVQADMLSVPEGAPPQLPNGRDSSAPETTGKVESTGGASSGIIGHDGKGDVWTSFVNDGKLVISDGDETSDLMYVKWFSLVRNYLEILFPGDVGEISRQLEIIECLTFKNQFGLQNFPKDFAEELGLDDTRTRCQQIADEYAENDHDNVAVETMSFDTEDVKVNEDLTPAPSMDPKVAYIKTQTSPSDSKKLASASGENASESKNEADGKVYSSRDGDSAGNLARGSVVMVVAVLTWLTALLL